MAGHEKVYGVCENKCLVDITKRVFPDNEFNVDITDLCEFNPELTFRNKGVKASISDGILFINGYASFGVDYDLNGKWLLTLPEKYKSMVSGYYCDSYSSSGDRKLYTFSVGENSELTLYIPENATFVNFDFVVPLKQNVHSIDIL